MPKIVNNRAVAVSQTIYGWLLRAYPPAHREEYGPAMAQLFRDQCREAWRESKGWGIMKLWLRVLPDLVKTSIIERIAASNQSKSRSNKITVLFQSRRVFLKVSMVVFLLVLGYSIAVAFLLPETYASTVRIKVEQEAEHNSGVAWDPQFLQNTFEIIQSQTVLKPVIDELNLNVMWGKKYFAGTTLKFTETLEIINGRIILTPVRGTKLISITAYSDDKMEAASLANAVAESYRDYRIKSGNELAAKRIEALAPGREKEAAQLEAQIPKPSLVQIMDKAEPGHAPVRPNKTLNITLGMVVGIVFGTVAGWIVVVVQSWFARRAVPSDKA